MRQRLALAFGLLLSSTGCDKLRNRDDAPQQPQQPVQVPTTPPPQQPQQPQNNGGTNNGGGGFQIPGLGNLPIPIPNMGNGNGGSNNNGAPQRVGDPSPLPAGALDATGAFTEQFQEWEARNILNELVAALEPQHQTRVTGIPLNFTTNPAEVNAAAGCSRTTREPFMLMTRGILRLIAATSEAKAVDEAANSQLLSQYMDFLVTRVRNEQEVLQIPAGSVPPAYASNPTKLARQRFLFDSQVAFILGHELAHHYRGHTGCASRGANAQQTDMESITRAASGALPPLNQPLEVEADTWGIVNTLDAGNRRPAHWNEDGAFLSMDFFTRLEGERGRSPILIFVRTHPPALLRRPIIQVWASNWRNGHRPNANDNNGGGNNGGNNGNSAGGNPLPFPIPIPLPR